MIDAKNNGPSDIEARFLGLVAEWKASRGHLSSITRMSQLPAYRAIVAMGQAAVPLLLRELEQRPDHWFWALREITGENPVAPESRGNVAEMARHWLDWGENTGIANGSSQTGAACFHQKVTPIADS